MDLEEIKKSSVYILWDNLDMNDTLLECRKVWKEKYAFINQTSFDELAENYVGENPNDQIKAFGQELTAFGYNLYDIASKNMDDFLFVLVHDNETDSFVKQCKKLPIKCKHYKQAGRKPGETAKRVNPKEKMPCETYLLPKHLSVRAVAGDYAFGRTVDEPVRGFVIHLAGNSTNVIYCNLPVYTAAFCNLSGYYAVATSKKTRDYRIRIGLNPEDINNWSEVDVPGGLSSRPSMSWINEKLYFGLDMSAFEVSIKKEGSLFQKIFSQSNQKITCKTLLSQESKTGYMYFAKTANDTIYFSGSSSFDREIYCYKNNEVSKLNFTRTPNSFLRAVASGASSIYYCQGIVGKRNSIIPIMVDLNLSTQKYRYRELKNMDEWAYLKTFDEKWTLILTSSGSTSKNKDLLQLWNTETDQFLRLKAGAFGKDNLGFIQKLSNGEIVFLTASAGTGYSIRKTTDFWQFIYESNQQQLLPNEWQISEKIYPDSDF